MATGRGVNQGKTEFLTAYLPDNPSADHASINAAWKNAGQEGTISESLLAKVRARLRQTGSKGPARRGRAVGRKSAEVRVTRTRRSNAPAAGRPRAGRPNKSAFIREALTRDGSLDLAAVGGEWSQAGHEGTISPNLFYKAKADLGIPSGRAARERVAEPPAEATERGTGDGRTRASRGGSSPASSHGGSRARALEDLEAEIDELIYRARDLGGLDEVQEALRVARRLLVLSHGA